MFRAVRRGGVAASLLLAGPLAACASAPQAAEETTLSVILADDWASTATVTEVVSQFERDHEGVRVRVQGAPFSQILDMTRTAAELDQPYDVAHFHAFAAGATGDAQAIGDLWDAHGLSADRYLDGAVQGVTWDGDVRYGVPLDVNAMVLLANERLLEAAAITPDDLADASRFLEVARSLADSDEVDHALTVSGSTWAAYGWVRAFGGDVLQRASDGTVTFTFDDPRTVSALDALGQLVEDGSAPPPFAPDLALDAVAAFASGATALHASGSWDLSVTSRSVDAELTEDDVAVLPLPRGRDEGADTGTVLGGSSLFIPTGSEQRELAFAFMLALTEPEVGLQFAFEEGRLPALVAAYDDPRFSADDRLAAFVEELADADVMPLLAYPGLDTGFAEAVELVLRGEDAALTLAELQARAERTYGDVAPGG